MLALAVPWLGYGAAPTLAALVLYFVLPILETSMAGLQNVSGSVRDAARGMGFSAVGMLFAVELPLALPFILAGLRTAVIINIGTATIGSTVGALSLGTPIVEGLSPRQREPMSSRALSSSGSLLFWWIGCSK